MCRAIFLFGSSQLTESNHKPPTLRNELTVAHNDFYAPSFDRLVKNVLATIPEHDIVVGSAFFVSVPGNSFRLVIFRGGWGYCIRDYDRVTDCLRLRLRRCRNGRHSFPSIAVKKTNWAIVSSK